MRFKLWPLLFIVAFLALLPRVGACISVAVWDGRFPLQVDLRSPQDGSIIEVAGAPLHSRDFPDYVVTHPHELNRELEWVNWVEGQPFIVRVPCSGHETSWGQELRYFQYNWLVLRITYKNGNVEYLPVSIPDGRKSRQITISLDEQKPARK